MGLERGSKASGDRGSKVWVSLSIHLVDAGLGAAWKPLKRLEYARQPSWLWDGTQ